MPVTRTLRHLRRKIYGLRAYIPGMRRHHMLESMVGPLGFWKELQDYQFKAVTTLGLKPSHHLLDFGCGPLQGGEAFISYLEPRRYFGIDHRPKVIEVGHEQVRRRKLQHKEPTLLHSTSLGENELGDAAFDFIWASQVLYYFDEPGMNQLFKMVRSRLKPSGVMAGDILAVDADRSFLRPPLPPVHTAESLNLVAQGHGLQVEYLGPILQFGYPRRLGLRTNVLLKITHR